jgi:hypothetical protein
MNSPPLAVVNPPLAQLQPVGLTIEETAAVLHAAQRESQEVRWVLPLPGFKPDAYVAHMRSVDLPDEQPFAGARPPASPGAPRRLVVDERGFHAGHPVCLLGNVEGTHSGWMPERQNAQAELHDTLRYAASQLLPVRLRYALAHIAWLLRKHWKTSQFRLWERKRLIAVIEPARWHMALAPGVTPQQLAQASLETVPSSTPLQTLGMEDLAMPLALWTLAQRCPEDALLAMLPTSFRNQPLMLRNALPLPAADAGKHAVAVLDALEAKHMTEAELQHQLRIPEDVLLRALTCLAMGRSIRTVPGRFAGSKLVSRLPDSLRHSLFPPSTEFD